MAAVNVIYRPFEFLDLVQTGDNFGKSMVSLDVINGTLQIPQAVDFSHDLIEGMSSTNFVDRAGKFLDLVNMLHDVLVVMLPVDVIDWSL